MIQHDKLSNALRAINAVLVLARVRCRDTELFNILDDAEYLPALMLEPEDRTREFREYLEGMAKKYANFERPLQRFDQPDPGA